MLWNGGRVKSQHQAEAEQVLLNHDRTQLWVDLKLGITKKQLDDHKREGISQAKSFKGLEQAYNFDDTHSVNPVSGQPDDSTAYTKTMHHSAYDVVVGDDDSEMDDIVAEPYEDKEGVQGMELDIDQLHHLSESRAGTASKELQASLSRPS